MSTWSVTSENGSSAVRQRTPEREPRARRGRGLLTGALALACLGGEPLAAQELDAGQLQWRQDGRRVGVERFRVWRTGSTVNAVASIQRQQGEERQVGLQMDPDFLPTKYQLTEGRTPLISGERFADRMRFHTVSEDGERWKEFPARAVRAIVEPGVAHHYLVLLRILQEAGGGRVSVVVPSRGEIAVARLAGEASDRVALGEGSVTATRYDIELGGTVRSVWLDSDGRLLRVLDPATGRDAIRLPARH